MFVSLPNLKEIGHKNVGRQKIEKREKNGKRMFDPNVVRTGCMFNKFFFFFVYLFINSCFSIFNFNNEVDDGFDISCSFCSYKLIIFVYIKNNRKFFIICQTIKIRS